MSNVIITYIPENINDEINRLVREKGLVGLGSVGRFIDEDGTAYHMEVADPVLHPFTIQIKVIYPMWRLSTFKGGL